MGTGVVRITCTGVRSGVLMNMRITLTKKASRMRTGTTAEAAVERATGRFSSVANGTSPENQLPSSAGYPSHQASDGNASLHHRHIDFYPPCLWSEVIPDPVLHGRVT